MSAPKFTFLAQLPPVHKNCERASNPVKTPVYQDLLGSAFLVNFTATNKQLPNANSAFKSLNHISKS